jgi:hydroxyethylthiazole kinase-like uncharacterized protein yjeF
MIHPDKLFSAEQIKAADAYTIQHEPITSLALMERAASACLDWIQNKPFKQANIHVFCGPGNNGGDGLALARLLLETGYAVGIYVVRGSGKCSSDFSANEQRLKEMPTLQIREISEGDTFPLIHEDDIIIDALFGTGLSKPVSGLAAGIIQHLNESKAMIISIDIASGLHADKHTDLTSAVIKPTYTLSFQFPKLAFLFADNETFVGQFEILDIGLHKQFIEQAPSKNYFLTDRYIKSLLRPRGKFAHKGSFGHALLIAGSYGKMGAAVLSAKAALRSGVGLLTVHIPVCGYGILQSSVPEAMVIADEYERYITESVVPENYSAIGIGPGIGTETETQVALKNSLASCSKPLVLDADALNCISLNKELLSLIPKNSILTPHVKEFERLTQKATDDFDRNRLQVEFSAKHQVYVVLKGAHTCISTPEGDCYFNCTGNPGMAKGGSGDVLTGVLTGLLAQGYSPLHAALIGVYAHGLAGDKAKALKGETAMIATDIINALPEAFMQLMGNKKS